MICDRYQELLSADIDGELTDSEQHDLQSHLHECAACRRKCDAMREQHELLSSSVAPSQPTGLRSKIKARIGIREHNGLGEPCFIGHILHRSGVGTRIAAKKSVAGPTIGPWGRA